MDSITQAVLGAAVGEAVLGRKLGWSACAWGALFGTLPDLDVVFMPFLNEVERIYWHRGISHSLFMMCVGALVFGPALWRYWKWRHQRSLGVEEPQFDSWLWRVLHRLLCWRGNAVSLTRACVFVFLVWSTHVIIDCFTTYGTSLWEPFYDGRAWWNVLFIIDPLFTIPMILGLFFSVLIFRKYEQRSLANSLGILLSCFYVCFALAMKSQASRQFDVAMKGVGGELVSASPMALNTILWRGLGETETEYLIGHWSPFDEDDTIQFERVAKNRDLLDPFKESSEFGALDWFSQGEWTAEVREKTGRVVLIDRRFSEMRIEQDGEKKSLPIFAWELWRNEAGDVQFQQAQMGKRRVNMKQQLSDLWGRIWGDENW